MSSSSLPLEIERKYLIHHPDPAFLASQDGAYRIDIRQTYLTPDAAGNRRIRRWEDRGGVKFIITRKEKVTAVTRIERESELTESAYLALLAEADPARETLVKTRWRLPYRGQELEIDLYPFWTKIAVLEVELTCEEQPVLLPPWLDLIREVTGEEAYSNASLSKLLKDRAGIVPENL